LVPSAGDDLVAVGRRLYSVYLDSGRCFGNTLRADKPQKQKAYSVWQSGQVVAVYAPVASGLVTFK
jgi:hypothetical protein